MQSQRRLRFLPVVVKQVDLAHKVKAEAAGLTPPLFALTGLRWRKQSTGLASFFAPTSPRDQVLYQLALLG